MNIHFNLGQWRLNISRNVVQIFYRLETVYETMFWRHMKHFQRIFKKISFLLQIEPHQAVPLQRQAMRAEGIAAGIGTAIRHKPAELAMTYRTFNTIAFVEHSYNP
jgi:hypothetical protein